MCVWGGGGGHGWYGIEVFPHVEMVYLAEGRSMYAIEAKTCE